MPGFYRKKRRKTGPSKNEQKVQRGLDAEAQAHAAGTLSSRYPSVKGLKFRITVTSPQGVTLDEAEDQLGPDDAFQIEADCPGRCGSGHYDYSELIGQALSRMEEHGSAALVCGEPLYGGGPEPCGCTAKCEFEAEYSAN